eukprot:jgi/Chlat1/1291/Chrsp118S01728
MTVRSSSDSGYLTRLLRALGIRASGRRASSSGRDSPSASISGSATPSFASAGPAGESNDAMDSAVAAMDAAAEAEALAAIEAAGGEVGPALKRHVSLHSRVLTYVIFRNNTAGPVKLLWLNYQGEEIAYRTVAPGVAHRQQTYMTHPWVFRDAAARHLVVEKKEVFYAEYAEQQVVIEEPAILPWSPATHARFPEEFQQTTQELLLTHHRASCQEVEWVGRNCGGSAELAQLLGSLPLDLVLLIVEKSAPVVIDIIPVETVPPPVIV